MAVAGRRLVIWGCVYQLVLLCICARWVRARACVRAVARALARVCACASMRARVWWMAHVAELRAYG